MSETDDRIRQLEAEIERRLVERFAALRDEFDRLRLEADRRWAGFLSRFDQDFTGIVPPELLAPPAPLAEAVEPAPPASGEVRLDEVRALDTGENQVEVLRRFLDLCRGHCSRAVLFVQKGSSLDAWKAVGFSERGGNDEAMRKVSVRATDATVNRVLEGEPARLVADNSLSHGLGVTDASDVVLIPMVVREKVSGLVYADSAPGEEDGFRPDTLALLTYLAGTVVDRLASRRLRPSPPLKPIERAQEPVAPMEGAQEPVAREAPPIERPAPAPPPPPPAPPPPREREEVQEFELAEEVEPESAEPAMPSFASAPPAEAPAAPRPVEMPPPPVAEPPPAEAWRSEVEPPPMPRAVEPPPPAPASSAVEAPAQDSTSTRRLAGPLAEREGDERREEARRFARLLVSEIKLYNERAVMEGRERKDLYARLREDIDRSRQMYDERIPEDVRSSSNFFYEEMVRILADGRPEALGL